MTTIAQLLTQASGAGLSSSMSYLHALAYSAAAMMDEYNRAPDTPCRQLHVPLGLNVMIIRSLSFLNILFQMGLWLVQVTA